MEWIIALMLIFVNSYGQYECGSRYKPARNVTTPTVKMGTTVNHPMRETIHPTSINIVGKR